MFSNSMKRDSTYFRETKRKYAISHFELINKLEQIKPQPGLFFFAKSPLNSIEKSNRWIVS